MNWSLIRPHLYLGDFNDADNWSLARLCVLEGPPSYSGGRRATDFHVPILTSQSGPPASPQQLDVAAECINDCLVKELVLLVHCGAGVERSPLTVAWWLRRTGQHPTLAAAYEELIRLRPVAQDRRAWLPEEFR